MILELILALILGLLAGTFTGLFPGIHINLVSAVLLSSLAFLSSVPPIALVVFIVSMSITHTFLDFITSILLGAPDDSSFLSILPGHKLLQEGKGYQAIILTLYGSLASIILIVLLSPLLILLIPHLSTFLQPFLPFILIFASLYLIFREDKFLLSLTVFLLAGFLGFLTLNLPIKEPLLPLLTGLFGLSSLFVSIKDKTKIPKQSIIPLKEISLPKIQFIKSSLAALITAPISSFLPGMGSGQAAVLASEITEHNSPKQFLYLLGMINTIVMFVSFITLYTINKTRSGSAVAIKSLLPSLSAQETTIIIFASLLSGLMAFFLGVVLAKFFSKNINKINYSKISIITIIILIAVNIFFTNLLGLLVLLTATALGVFCILSNSRRTNLMGSLLIPTILFYLI